MGQKSRLKKCNFSSGSKEKKQTIYNKNKRGLYEFL
jgi:hypothetical protein